MQLDRWDVPAAGSAAVGEEEKKPILEDMRFEMVGWEVLEREARGRWVMRNR